MTASNVFVLRAADGLSIAVTNAGAAWMSCRVPVDGDLREVLLGYPTEADYLTQPGYLGAIIGRYTNRIAGASFELGGRHTSCRPMRASTNCTAAQVDFTASSGRWSGIRNPNLNLRSFLPTETRDSRVNSVCAPSTASRRR